MILLLYRVKITCWVDAVPPTDGPNYKSVRKRCVIETCDVTLLFWNFMFM